MDFKLCLLENWEIAEEATKYLLIQNKISPSFEDKTLPQNCLAIYSPNTYQNIIDHVSEKIAKNSNYSEMEIEVSSG
jgi:hypothetical protein